MGTQLFFPIMKAILRQLVLSLVCSTGLCMCVWQMHKVTPELKQTGTVLDRLGSGLFLSKQGDESLRTL